MKTVTSVRLEPELQEKLDRAARLVGKPASQIIREAVEEKVAHLLEEPLDVALDGLIGTVNYGHSDASQATGKRFAEAMVRKREEGHL